MTQVIETDEEGRLVLPAELLGEAKPHTRYTVESLGTKLILGLEETDADGTQRLAEVTPDEWMRQWRELSEEIGKVWPEGVSAVDVVSEMRSWLSTPMCSCPRSVRPMRLTKIA